MEVVIEQSDCEDSPTAANGNPAEESPPMTAVGVVEDDVASLEAALSDVVDSVCDVDTVRAGHFRLLSRGLGVGRSNFKIGLGSWLVIQNRWGGQF